MDYRNLAAVLSAFVAYNEEVAGLWNGEDANQFEEPAMTASHLRADAATPGRIVKS
jgi:hypothetical protein